MAKPSQPVTRWKAIAAGFFNIAFGAGLSFLLVPYLREHRRREVSFDPLPLVFAFGVLMILLGVLLVAMGAREIHKPGSVMISTPLKEGMTKCRKCGGVISTDRTSCPYCLKPVKS